MKDVSTIEMIIRVLFCLFIGIFIGAEREKKSRPAGIKTHILVCISACIIAILQEQLAIEALKYAVKYPEYAGVVRADPARLIAQVVSGVGFLGAGTIVLKKHSVLGLTTAASVWAVAGLGLAVGMGYYRLAIVGSVAIYFSLTMLEKIITVPKTKKLEVYFKHRAETKSYLNQYFSRNKIEVEDVSFEADNTTSLYKYVFTIELPRNMSYSDVINDLSIYENVTKISMIAIV